MVQIGNVPEIIEVKNLLDELKQRKLAQEWELPHENLLTRRSAAVFFLTPVDESKVEEIWGELKKYQGFDYRKNAEQKLSKLKYRITFDKGFILGKGYVGEENASK